MQTYYIVILDDTMQKIQCLSANVKCYYDEFGKEELLRSIEQSRGIQAGVKPQTPVSRSGKAQAKAAAAPPNKAAGNSRAPAGGAGQGQGHRRNGNSQAAPSEPVPPPHGSPPAPSGDAKSPTPAQGSGQGQAAAAPPTNGGGHVQSPSLVPGPGQGQAAVASQGRAARTRRASTPAATHGSAGDKSPKQHRSSGQQPMIAAQNVALASLGKASLAQVCPGAASRISESIVASRPPIRQRSLSSNRQSSRRSPAPTPPVPPRNKSSRHLPCAHAVRRTLCKVCNKAGQGSLCVHLRQKVHCRVCRTTRLRKEPGALKSFCRHGRQRSRCVKCHGSGICIHNREKYRCKECEIASKAQLLNA